jgi:hypothetical protein
MPAESDAQQIRLLLQMMREDAEAGDEEAQADIQELASWFLPRARRIRGRGRALGPDEHRGHPRHEPL